MVSKDDGELSEFTDTVLVSSAKETKGWRETKRATYVGKKNGKFYEITVSDDENTYDGQPAEHSVSDREISEQEYQQRSHEQ